MMFELGEWLAFAPQLEQIYQTELGRSCFSDPEAFVNWTYHRVIGDKDLAWIRDRIRESEEWKQRHGGGQVPSEPPASPAPPAPSSGGPVAGGGRVYQVTNESDGAIPPRMMSDRANVYLHDNEAYVFCGTGSGPQLFRVELESGAVQRLGPIGSYGGETEGWYWMPDGTIVLPLGGQLLRYNPFTGGGEVLLDVNASHPGCDLWQPHSSDDGRTHSATVRRIVPSGRYPYIATVVLGPRGIRFEPAIGQIDESQVTRAGTHVVIKQNGEDNTIIDLVTGGIWELADADGAIGHSDCGPDFIVGESNLPGPGRCVKLDLRTRQRLTLFETDNMGYVSVRGGRCLHSDDTHLSAVSLTGAGQVALLAHGASGTNNYDNRPKANLDPTGRVACYMSNPHGRRDVFLYVLA